MKNLKLISTLIATTTLLTSTTLFAATETKPVVNKIFDEPITGKVIEKINAASYTYLKIKTKKDETWVAVPQLEIKLDTEVEVLKPIPNETNVGAVVGVD